MQQPKWISIVLFLAALRCLLGGVYIMLCPEHSFRTYGFAEELKHPLLWEGSGFTIGLYGVGYALAWHDPKRHYGLILMGLLAKIFGSLGVAWGYLDGVLFARALFWAFVNDAIWFLPLGLIVYCAYKSGIER